MNEKESDYTWMTGPEACRYLGISERLFYRFRQLHPIRVRRIKGFLARYSKEDLDSIIAAPTHMTNEPRRAEAVGA